MDNRLEQKLEIMIIIGAEEEFMIDYICEGGRVEIMDEVIERMFVEKKEIWEKIKLLY